MTFKSVKMRWMRKLATAKYFVILTDKESVIAIDGVDPKSFQDTMSLSAQTAELEMFYNKLGDLIKDHELALDKLNGVHLADRIKRPRSYRRVQGSKTKIRTNSSKEVKNKRA